MRLARGRVTLPGVMGPGVASGLLGGGGADRGSEQRLNGSTPFSVTGADDLHTFRSHRHGIDGSAWPDFARFSDWDDGVDQ